MNEITWTNTALKQLAKIPAKFNSQIRVGVAGLLTWPDVNNVIKLVNLPGYRLRVGRYRVIFTVYPSGEVTILQIDEVLKRDERTYS